MVGDVEFAGDTTILADIRELPNADEVFLETTDNWEDKAHVQKNDGIVLAPGGRSALEARNRFERPEVKHAGGWLAEAGSGTKVTDHRFCLVSFSTSFCFLLYSSTQ